MNRVYACKAEPESDHGSGCDDGVEPNGVRRLCLEGRLPSECLSYAIGRGAGQHWNCQQACADNTERKQHEGKITREWPERLSGLRCRIDVGDTMGVQDGGRGQNDRKGDHVGEDHSDSGVDLDAIDLGDTALGELSKRTPSLALHFLDFLRGLPEK